VSVVWKGACQTVIPAFIENIGNMPAHVSLIFTEAMV